VLGGELQAFSHIVVMTEGLVARIVNQLIPNREDRKDVAQDIYLKVYQHLHGFKFQSKLSTWVGQIAYNTCLNRLQKKQPAIADPPELPADDATDRKLLRKELDSLLAAEIGRLPPLYQTLIGLYHHEDLSYQEIAGITGLPEGTVKSYLFRARRQLKETILAIYKKEKL
jgi:RNA polymerase sigma-70 factor (ECF subfamily)